MRCTTMMLASLCVPLLLPAATPIGQDQDARPVRSRLAEPAVIEGIPCDAWYVWRFPGGRLHECRLSTDAVVRGATLPARTIVVFEPDGTFDYVFLPRTSAVDGHRIRGHGHGWMTELHPNGKLKLGWLAEHETIDGIACEKATFLGEFFGRRNAATEFHDSGRLAACRLSRDIELDGKRLRKGRRITLDPAGRLLEPKAVTDDAPAPAEPDPGAAGGRRPPARHSR